MKNTRSLLRLSWRQLRRDLASGELRVLFAALMLAVLAVTAVGFVTDRAQRALALEANRLLGGDAVLRSDSDINDALRALAQDPRLARSEIRSFNSMLRTNAGLKLGEVRVLGIVGIGHCPHELGIARNAAAVFGRRCAGPSDTQRQCHQRIGGVSLLDRDAVIPVVAEVVDVVQRRLAQCGRQPRALARDRAGAVVHRIGCAVALAVAGDELVQVRVAPAC